MQDSALQQIDTSSLEGDTQVVISKLQEFQNAYFELQELSYLRSLGFDVDVESAEEKVEAFASELQNLPPAQAEILAEIVPNVSSPEKINEGLSYMTTDTFVKIDVDPEPVNDYMKEVKQFDATIPWKNDLTDYYNFVRTPKVANATIKFKPDLVDVYAVFSQYNITGFSGNGNTTTAPAPKGTASSKFDPADRAFANGTDVAIQHSEEAIVNELGEEGLIRNGVFTKILGGMRKMKLRVGDIILNHKQVQELEKNGYVTSNGGRQTEIFVCGKEYKNPFIHSLPYRDVTAYYQWNFIHILSTQIRKLSTFHQQKSGGYQQKTS